MTPTIELLKRIWTNDIAKDLQSGTLINERTLQAAMYHHVRSQGKSHGLSVRLEVKKFMSGRGIPDMVVVNTRKSKREVEAVIEFKLGPSNKGIVYQTDIRKLIGWAVATRSKRRSKRRSKDRLDVHPETLVWAGDLYTFTPRTSWIFAVIGTDGYDALDSKYVAKYATDYAGSKGYEIDELNLWLFPGVLGKQAFGPVEKLKREHPGVRDHSR